eukprot:5520718-Amphidinium_carterae.1
MYFRIKLQDRHQANVLTVVSSFTFLCLGGLKRSDRFLSSYRETQVHGHEGRPAQASMATPGMDARLPALVGQNSFRPLMGMEGLAVDIHLGVFLQS